MTETGIWCIVDPLDLQVAELKEVRQVDIPSLSCPDADGSVIVNDSVVVLNGECCKVALDVSPVAE